MQRTLFALALTVAGLGFAEARAQNPRSNPGLPKVDFQMARIYAVGQGLAIPVKNLGFERSPSTTVAVVVYDLRSRQLIKTERLDVAPLQPNQTRRMIIVPRNQGKPVLVRAIVDPGNRIAETNERNNQTASQH